MGFVHAHEAFRVEFAFQPGERGADLEGLVADMQHGVVARGLDPVDVGDLDHDLAALAAHGEAFGQRSLCHLGGRRGRHRHRARQIMAQRDRPGAEQAVGDDIFRELVEHPVGGERKAVRFADDAAEPQEPERRHAQRMGDAERYDRRDMDQEVARTSGDRKAAMQPVDRRQQGRDHQMAGHLDRERRAIGHADAARRLVRDLDMGVGEYRDREQRRPDRRHAPVERPSR